MALRGAAFVNVDDSRLNRLSRVYSIKRVGTDNWTWSLNTEPSAPPMSPLYSPPGVPPVRKNWTHDVDELFPGNNLLGNTKYEKKTTFEKQVVTTGFDEYSPSSKPVKEPTAEPIYSMTKKVIQQKTEPESDPPNIYSTPNKLRHRNAETERGNTFSSPDRTHQGEVARVQSPGGVINFDDEEINPILDDYDPDYIWRG